MYKHILVPLEPSHTERHTEALQVARHLAADETAEITVLTVIEPVPGYIGLAETLPDIRVQAENHSIKMLKDLVGDSAGIKTKVLHGHAGNEIVAYAEKHDADCIVIASHQPTFSDYLIGSTAGRVVRHAKCAVHVTR